MARAHAEAARHAFLKVVELAPESWQGQLFLADASRQQRKFPEAIEHYKRSAELEPDSYAAILGLGIVYWELADDELARST